MHPCALKEAFLCLFGVQEFYQMHLQETQNIKHSLLETKGNAILKAEEVSHLGPICCTRKVQQMSCASYTIYLSLDT